jgi:hypothetical protein
MTIREWLDRIAASDASTEKDSQNMQYILRKGMRISEVEQVVLPKARVVLGVVYPEGSGHPVSIQWMAKTLLGR